MTSDIQASIGSSFPVLQPQSNSPTGVIRPAGTDPDFGPCLLIDMHVATVSRDIASFKVWQHILPRPASLWAPRCKSVPPLTFLLGASLKFFLTDLIE